MINMTSEAIERIKLNGSIANQEIPLIRIYVQGAGCSGFMYKFKIEKEAEEDDFKFTQDGVCLLVDPLSYQYLQGATLDYETDVFNSRFVVNNPNSKTQCGCGESFSV